MSSKYVPFFLVEQHQHGRVWAPGTAGPAQALGDGPVLRGTCLKDTRQHGPISKYGQSPYHERGGGGGDLHTPAGHRTSREHTIDENNHLKSDLTITGG